MTPEKLGNDKDTKINIHESPTEGEIDKFSEKIGSMGMGKAGSVEREDEREGKKGGEH